MAAGACFGSVCGSWGWSSNDGSCEEHLQTESKHMASPLLLLITSESLQDEALRSKNTTLCYKVSLAGKRKGPRSSFITDFMEIWNILQRNQVIFVSKTQAT